MTDTWRNPLLLVRALKGAPLSVYMVLLVMRQPASAEYLAMYTDYSPNVVAQALTYLTDTGLVRRNGRTSGWMLVDGATQLPLPADNAAHVDKPVDKPVDKLPERTSDSEVQSSESEVRRSSLVDRSIDITRDENLASLEQPTSNSESPEPDFPEPDAGEEDSIASLLDKADVRDPKRTEILRMKGITPDMVRYHLATSQNTGQAIYRIQHRWRVNREMNEDEQRSAIVNSWNRAAGKQPRVDYDVGDRDK